MLKHRSQDLAVFEWQKKNGQISAIFFRFFGHNNDHFQVGHNFADDSDIISPKNFRKKMKIEKNIAQSSIKIKKNSQFKHLDEEIRLATAVAPATVAAGEETANRARLEPSW